MQRSESKAMALVPAPKVSHLRGMCAATPGYTGDIQVLKGQNT